MTALLAAMRQVESHGNDHAVGDQGRSRGPYQIQRAYWVEGGGRADRYGEDVVNPFACVRVILGYWRRHCPHALAGGDLQGLARTHNGGPAGSRRTATQDYWRRVRAAMSRTEVDPGPAQRGAARVGGEERRPGPAYPSTGRNA